jgi:Flp pilus assembly pilin Flp
VLFPPCWNEGVWLRHILKETEPVAKLWQNLWSDERGQDIAEYAVMLAVILVIVVGTVRLIGSNANNVFSNVGSAIQ